MRKRRATSNAASASRHVTPSMWHHECIRISEPHRCLAGSMNVLRGFGADQTFACPSTGGRACRRFSAVPNSNVRPRRPSGRTRRHDGRVRAVATADDVAEAAWSTKEVLAGGQY